MRDSYNDLTYNELLTKKEELTRRFREVRFDKVVGHLENPLELRTVRKKIARINTIIHEYKLRIRGDEK
jgi:large subunit ribosomal protein L29